MEIYFGLGAPHPSPPLCHPYEANILIAAWLTGSYSELNTPALTTSFWLTSWFMECF